MARTLVMSAQHSNSSTSDVPTRNPTPSHYSKADPFATPPLSSRPSRVPTRAHSIDGSSSSSSDYPAKVAPSYFRSRRTTRREQGEHREVQKDKKAKWLWIIPFIGFLCGLAICGVLIYFGIEKEQYQYCSVLDEDFSGTTLNPKIWTTEVQVNGFGNMAFDETTTSPNNLFIKNGQLHIQPTLQDASLIINNSTLNLTQTGTCTSDITWPDCFAHTNTTNGTIVPPTISARINTKKSVSIKYGRVEVRAKVSKGDWLWPAIWMLPKDSVYGPWPASGEIDIMETRGNNYTYGPGGNNIASSTLHFGPDAEDDGYLTATNTKAALHSEYGDDFHTYGLEWTPTHLYTYIDTKLLQVLYIPFTQRFWNRGHFPAASPNGTLLLDPWAASPDINAPFDQEFFLILNVDVGGTNGWFPDGAGGKPWVDASDTAPKDFWDARSQWDPTWKEDSAMIIDSVKIWKQC